MIRKMLIPAFLLSLAVLPSCSTGTHDHTQFLSIKGQTWDYKDTLSYEFGIKDTAEYRISLSVRYEKEYEFSNIWIKANDGSINSRIELPLFNLNGQPLGKCSGGLCTQTLGWKDVQLNGGDTIRLHIVQNMRKNPLRGVSEVGVIIDRIP